MAHIPEHFWDFIEDGDLPKFAEKQRNLEIAAAALLKLREYGIPADTQDLLVNGSKRAGVRPGALVAALSASMSWQQGTLNGTGTAVPSMPTSAGESTT